jgi:hypothetical protein
MSVGSILIQEIHNILNVEDIMLKQTRLISYAHDYITCVHTLKYHRQRIANENTSNQYIAKEDKICLTKTKLYVDRVEYDVKYAMCNECGNVYISTK